MGHRVYPDKPSSRVTILRSMWLMHLAHGVVKGFVNETRRNCRDGETRRDGWDGRLIVTRAFETELVGGDDNRLAHNPEVPLPLFRGNPQNPTMAHLRHKGSWRSPPA